MTGFELDNFYKADQLKYKIEQNREILDYFIKKHHEGINFILDIKQMQQVIDEIVLFFECKYPDNFLNKLDHLVIAEHDKRNIEICRKISKAMDIEQLKFRLYHDYVQFLDCPYGYMISISKPEENLWDTKKEWVRINQAGFVDPHDLDSLKEFNFLHDITGIQKISDLLGRFIESETNVDYLELKRAIITHKNQVQIRNMLLNVIPLALLYSKTTLPNWGYIRAKSFIRMFNQEYDLHISTDEIDAIMKQDYSKSKQKVFKANH